MTAPTKIGKYEIRRQIGRGAMGVVHEAFDPVIERRVAVKTLRLDIFDPEQSENVRARFKREAQSAGQLAHPHIVTVFDYGEHEDTPYIVMEYLAGNELSKIMGRGTRLPLSEVVRLMTQLLGALTYAHERKVVHRDVKPGNIFILDDGSLKVVDFGLAHVEASNLTDTGAMLGTPAYMSPEQFLTLPVDERSDIFSAGVILYELLTGDKPFTGTVTSIMQKVLRQEPMEPSTLNPTLSAAWDTVVRRAMAKKPDARFQTARQFSEMIKQVFEKGALNVSVEVTLTGSKAADLGGETLRPGAMAKQAVQEHRPVPPVTVASDIAPTESSSKTGLAIGVAAIVIAVGAATIYLIQRPKNDLAKQEPPAKTAQQDAGAAEKAAAERVAADKVAADAKAAADKSAAEAKAAADKSAQEAKLAQEGARQDKAADAKKATEKAKSDKIAAEKAAKAAEEEIQKRVAAQVAQREKAKADQLEAERIAAEKEAADKAAAQKSEAERARQLASSALEVNKSGNEFYNKKMYAEAAEKYRIAIQMNYAPAQFNLGRMYELGLGVPKDEIEAVRLYRLSANQGNANGQTNLGLMYRLGKGGLTADAVEAARLYRLAANQAHAGGQANLGYLYQTGLGVEKDEKEALRLYRLSANQGNSAGQNNLGAIFEFGLAGQAKNLEEAVAWYKKSAAQGFGLAITNLKRLGRQ